MAPRIPWKKVPWSLLWLGAGGRGRAFPEQDLIAGGENVDLYLSFLHVERKG